MRANDRNHRTPVPERELERRTSSTPATRHLTALRKVRKGQTLLLAGIRFRILATLHQPGMISLELQADDGEAATLIGVPQARIAL